MKYGEKIPVEELKLGQTIKLNYTDYTPWSYHNRYNGDQVCGANANPGQVTEGTVSKITEKAICVDNSEQKYMWLPKSILKHDPNKMHINEFEIARWFCYKNFGLDWNNKN